MNNYKKIFIGLLISITIPIASYWLVFQIVEKKTDEALQDYSMLPNGVKVVDKVILGRKSKDILVRLKHGLKRGSLELVCTNQGHILLIMKDDVRHTTIYKRASLFTSFRIEDGVKKGKAEIEEMNFVNSEYLEKYFDTMVSNPLSKKEITSILQALKERKSNRIALALDNGGYSFIDHANISDVQKLINQCQKISNN